ncbi:MAG: SCO family protein [Thermodesulfobacteriota bacterium]
MTVATGSESVRPAAAARRRSAARTGLVLAVLLLAAAGTSWWLSVSARQGGGEPLPVLATVPDFSLIEASGRPITRRDLTGAPWVADLVFTHCAAICPTMTAEMSRLVRQSDDVTGAKFVSISVDPERDTPEVLTAYAERHGADRARWLFLTGDEKEIRRLALEGLKLPVADGDTAAGEDPILHSQRFVLVDAESRVRGTYDVRDPEAMLRLRGDLRRVGDERGAG